MIARLIFSIIFLSTSILLGKDNPQPMSKNNLISISLKASTPSEKFYEGDPIKLELVIHNGAKDILDLKSLKKRLLIRSETRGYSYFSLNEKLLSKEAGSAQALHLEPQKDYHLAILLGSEFVERTPELRDKKYLGLKPGENKLTVALNLGTEAEVMTSGEENVLTSNELSLTIDHRKESSQPEFFQGKRIILSLNHTKESNTFSIRFEAQDKTEFKVEHFSPTDWQEEIYSVDFSRLIAPTMESDIDSIARKPGEILVTSKTPYEEQIFKGSPGSFRSGGDTYLNLPKGSYWVRLSYKNLPTRLYSNFVKMEAP